MIGHIYGHNEGMVKDDTRYRWEYYRPETRKVQHGTVLHKRDAGIEPLICKILELTTHVI